MTATHDFRQLPAILTWPGLRALILQRLDRHQCECEGCARARRVLQAVDRDRQRARAWYAGILGAVGFVLVSASSPVQAQQSPQTTFRDSRGSTIGTATTSNGGSGVTTVFRDSRGSTTGTATTTPGGMTTYRDSGGRTVGTSSGARR